MPAQRIACSIYSNLFGALSINTYIGLFMYMKLLSCFVLLACCHLATAQPVEAPTFKRFGFQAGINVSNMNFNRGYPAPAAPIAAAWKPGICLGFLMRAPLGGKWLLQPEYSYTQRNGKDKSIDTDYQLDYFSLPLLLYYQVHPLVSVYAGPQGELLVRASATANGAKTNITHDTEERSIAAIAGIELHILQSLFVSARYTNGLNHIGIGQRSVVKEFKYDGVCITAGIHF